MVSARWSTTERENTTVIGKMAADMVKVSSHILTVIFTLDGGSSEKRRALALMSTSLLEWKFMEPGSKAQSPMEDGSTPMGPTMKVALLIRSQTVKESGSSRTASRLMVYTIRSRKHQLREKSLLLKKVLKMVVLLSPSSLLLGLLTPTSSKQLT